jgi:hypothetical protein
MAGGKFGKRTCGGKSGSRGRDGQDGTCITTSPVTRPDVRELNCGKSPSCNPLAGACVNQLCCDPRTYLHAEQKGPYIVCENILLGFPLMTWTCPCISMELTLILNHESLFWSSQSGLVPRAVVRLVA